MDQLTLPIREDYAPGLIAETIALHMAYYAAAWGFGAPFEAGLARDLGAFHATRDPVRDLVLSARAADGALLGTLTLDCSGEQAHLRWFIVADAARGTGLGRRMMERAAAHLDSASQRVCYLTTFRGLDAARRLYEDHGFALVAETEADPWSGTVGLQRFERVRRG